MTGRMERGNSGTIVKRGEGKLQDYRRVTIIPTLYKVYMSALTERMTEMKEKGIIPQS